VTASAMVFYVLASLCVVSAVMVVTRRSAIHAALFLVLAFFCVAGIYVILSAEFLAAVQVLVYAGGVMVLFLFVIMLVPQGGAMSGGSAVQHGGLVPQGGTLWQGIAVKGGSQAPQGDNAPQAGQAPQAPPVRHVVVSLMLAVALAGTIILWFWDSTPVGAAAGTRLLLAGGGNIEAVGMELYQRYLLPFEIASVLLLVAMIGAVVLARKKV